MSIGRARINGWGLLAGGVALLAAGMLAYQARRLPPAPRYTRAGYGGLVPPSANGMVKAPARQTPAARPAAAAVNAYNAGRYAEAEREAGRILSQSEKPEAGVKVHQEKARARWVLAFSAARRKDLRLARQRFAELKQAAAGEMWTLEPPRALPESASAHRADSATEDPDGVNRDRPVAPTGVPLATLEEEAAYQHAVLTQAVARETGAAVGRGKDAALGKNFSPEAERELVEFMRRYPESPLVHAAVRRIGMMHGGDIPKSAEKVWRAAMKAGQDRQHARDRERSLCGPEALAEVLRRLQPQVAVPSVGDLAQELKTDYQGTTLQAVAVAAERRGLATRGLRLTWDGLWKLTHGKDAPAPGSTLLMALIQPGHYVLIEEVTAGWVIAWNPPSDDRSEPEIRKLTRTEWEKVWSGVALQLSPNALTGAK